jgi:hypothetical protein
VVLEPSRRLGSSIGNDTGSQEFCEARRESIRKGYAALKVHPFFSSINFETIHNQPPPGPTTEEEEWRAMRDKLLNPDYDCTSETDTAELQEMMFALTPAMPKPDARESTGQVHHVKEHSAEEYSRMRARNHLIHVLHRQGILGPPFGYCLSFMYLSVFFFTRWFWRFFERVLVVAFLDMRCSSNFMIPVLWVSPTRSIVLIHFTGPRQAFQGRFLCHWMHESMMLP